MGSFIDLTGRKFGRLTVLSKDKLNKFNRWLWLCQCSCGVKKSIDGQALRNGNSNSCGCFNVEQKKSMCVKRNTKHGKRKTKEYSIWQTMRTRCNNKNSSKYPLYGGRGIYVHPRWERFENFLLDMGRIPSKSHTIDRIDSNGPYEPDNCRWVLQKVQQNNRRNNRLITHKGETKTLQQWANLTGINRKTISNRIDRGWTIDKALDFF